LRRTILSVSALPPVAFEVRSEPALEGGVYANAVAIWHTPHEFTLDFLVNAAPPTPGQNDEGDAVIKMPFRLVSRVRVAPTAVFDIIRAINENMTAYENQFGAIHRPGQDAPMFPPDNLSNTGS
jgi:Protein of unknown function (DUF3467)